MRNFKTIISLFAVAITVGAPLSPAFAAPPTSATIASDVATLTQWMEALQYDAPGQRSDGAFRKAPGAVETSYTYYGVSAYFGNLGVRGLLLSNVSDRIARVQKWAQWLFRHTNRSTGITYDYFYRADGTGESACPVSSDPLLCNHNDATDSSLATTFSILWGIYQNDHSPAFLEVKGRKSMIEAMAATLLKLCDAKRQVKGKSVGDDLFWARQNYKFKFTEDNSEVANGLAALVQIERVIYKDDSKAALYEGYATKVKAAITSVLYNASTRLYYTSKAEDGTLASPDLSRWYPGMQAQMWPHLWGVVAPKVPETTFVVGQLNTLWDGRPYTNWVKNPDQVVVDEHGNTQKFINADVAYAVYLTGDLNRTYAYLDSARRIKIRQNFPYPFLVSDAGWLLTMLTDVSAKLQSEGEAKPSSPGS